MKASIQDKEALAAISPAALSAYARAAGWVKGEAYGDHSDVYAREGAPEIVVPRIESLGDYPNVVSRLIEIFAEAAGTDALSLYRDLVVADRDVVRVRAVPEGGDGTVTLGDGVCLITAARDMMLAAACSLREPRPSYRAGANREAGDYLRKVKLGQTEQGSYVVTLLTPVVPPSLQRTVLFDSMLDDQPFGRQVTRRLAEALRAAREAAERTSGGDGAAFPGAVGRGVSANLCEALAAAIEPFHGTDVSLTWARTRPMEKARETVRFGASDAPILREAARCFREREPRPDVSLIGHIRRLRRDDGETDGTISLRTYIDGRALSVAAVLDHPDYDRAIQAHKSAALVVVAGDLERFGQRWRLRNPRIVDVALDEDEENGVDRTGDS